ncbi:putative Transcriptional regulator, LysR family protein [Vibrio nigripulchritudo MADA3029]|uniref:LysR family transcriptional regulator n=1 Tax=Vibrio nigripulchritudo TaxID=28173 RepID=UPI0003B1C52A|nr:LysR family transcriptional regulator [Vibrio nigripulchritudo]CCN49622.1 putative Transcriptional regulator, LysR family protein [Vibrio nigripulchritudo MADA3020]CCN53643.1 putative Transcriptional regulator, LysR family protein [Vibrio nigripulchritudo MADA3021]CCN58476.1 putative Transcriptional regulator, LysR family protein [Vibrio nigripulchritudo MADA3029]
MNIKLQQLMHFSYVVEEGGFRAASQRANRSQAALSTSIKELERTLGQPLFESGNKSTLTPFGEICVPKITQFLNVYHALDNDLRAAAAGQQGRVRIASVPSVAAKLIPSVLAAFCERFPDVEVSLIDDNATGVEARLMSGEVDLALGNCMHLDDQSMDFTPLISDPIGVVCLKDNPIASNMDGIAWETLLQQPFIRNGTCTLLESTPARVLSQKALYSVENITSLFSVLELGIGVTTLPKLAFPTNETRLVWIPLIDPPLQREIGIFRLSERTISPQAKGFHDLCIEYLNFGKGESDKQ